MSAGNLTSYENHLMVALAALNQPIQYRIDSKGRKVRVPDANNPVTSQETRDALLNMRVVEEEEVLEQLGKGVLDYMVKAGQLQRDTLSKTRFWITKKCAAAYNLPAYLGERTFIY